MNRAQLELLDLPTLALELQMVGAEAQHLKEYRLASTLISHSQEIAQWQRMLERDAQDEPETDTYTSQPVPPSPELPF